MIPFLDVGAGVAELRAELDAAIAQVLQAGWFVLGPQVRAFEEEWAAYCGARFAVGVNSGLDALRLSLRAAGIGPGDEVVVPAHTFVATWFAAGSVGATVVPAEVDKETYCIDPSAFRAAITPRTAAVVPVHLYGQPVDRQIFDIAAERKLFVLEDAAQAHGAAYGTERVGGGGRVAAWSFYPGKNLGALGDGGAVTCDDDVFAHRLRGLRNYGSMLKYHHEEVGCNSRLDELQAAVLRVKLRHLDAWNALRAAAATRYRKLLEDGPLVLPTPVPGTSHAWHLFVVRSTDRNRLQAGLRERGVETLIHYPLAPHLQPAFSSLGLGVGAFPTTEQITADVLSLPIGPHLDSHQIDAVAHAVAQLAGPAVAGQETR